MYVTIHNLMHMHMHMMLECIRRGAVSGYSEYPRLLRTPGGGFKARSPWKLPNLHGQAFIHLAKLIKDDPLTYSGPSIAGVRAEGHRLTILGFESASHLVRAYIYQRTSVPTTRRRSSEGGNLLSANLWRTESGVARLVGVTSIVKDFRVCA